MSGEVIFPDGPARERRWTPGRKAEVCASIMRGDDTPCAVIERYDLSPEELDEWMVRFRRLGVRGLTVTVQEVRDVLR